MKLKWNDIILIGKGSDRMKYPHQGPWNKQLGYKTLSTYSEQE